MRIVSYRVDAARDKKLSALFAQLGLNDESQTTNYLQMIDYFYNVAVKAKSVQTLNEANNKDIDISCPNRFRNREILKDIDPSTGKQISKWGFVTYCARFDVAKGRIEKPLKLVNPLEQCKRCKPELERWLAEQERLRDIQKVEPSIINPDPTPKHITEVLEQPILEQPIKKEPIISQRPKSREPSNTWHCPKRGDYVHYSVCLDECKLLTKNIYVRCLYEHTDISRNLDFWRSQREANLKKLTAKNPIAD